MLVITCLTWCNSSNLFEMCLKSRYTCIGMEGEGEREIYGDIIFTLFTGDLNLLNQRYPIPESVHTCWAPRAALTYPTAPPFHLHA